MLLRPLLCLICMFMIVNNADAAPFAYITNAGTGVGVDSVSIIDTSNNTIIKTVPIFNLVNGANPAHPYGVAVSRAGDRVYVSNQFSKTITVIDSSRIDNAVIQTIQRLNRPGGLAVNPAGSRLYVANEDNLSVSVFDTALMITNPASAEIASVTVGNGPTGVAVNSAGTKVYVTNAGSDTVSVIDAATNLKVGADIAVGANPQGIAFNAANNKLYVANYSSSFVSVIDTAISNVVTSVAIPASSIAAGVAVNAAGTRVYVSRAGSDAIAIIDATNDSLVVTPVITTGQGPWGVAVNPVNGLLYVANSFSGSQGVNGSVTAYDTATGLLSATPPGTILVNAKPQAFGNFIGPMMYPVTLTTGGNGTITPTPGTDTNFYVASGATQTFTVAPNSGLALADVKKDSVSVGAVSSVDVTGIAAPHTIDATFGYLVTVVKTGTGTGTVTGAGVPAFTPATAINYGATSSAIFPVASTVTLTATPDVPWVVTWAGCPSVSGNVCTIANLNAAKTVTANFGPAGGDTGVPAPNDPNGPPVGFYSLIMDAYTATTLGTATFKVKATHTPSETLDLINIGRDFPINLWGGYDNAQGTVIGTTEVHGLTIMYGTINVSGIAIK